MTWAWTSRPITTSHSPVAPCDAIGAVASAITTMSPACGEAGALLERQGGVEHALLVERAADDCRPSGRPCPSRPAGTDIAGRPARLAGTAKTSFRYMAIGSAIFSPRPKAADGAVGVRIRSQLSNACVEIARDQRPDLLRLVEIGVVEAGREHIGADHDPALDLGAEAGGAGRLVHVVEAALLRLRRAGRSGRRHSGRGWTRPRPAR